MHKIYRIFLVIIIVILFLIVLLDYFGFHGSILLDRIAGGGVVTVMDSVLSLFNGPDRSTNIMYMSIFVVGVSIGLIAIMYKFIKG